MEYIKKFGEFIDEGIDFDLNTKTVSYNPSHEDNVDTSIENNSTSDENLVPNIKVYSIFKRSKRIFKSNRKASRRKQRNQI